MKYDYYWNTFPVAKLPKEWSYLDGLRFPLFLQYGNAEMRFDNYDSYHEFIKKLFYPPKNETHTKTEDNL